MPRKNLQIDMTFLKKLFMDLAAVDQKMLQPLHQH